MLFLGWILLYVCAAESATISDNVVKKQVITDPNFRKKLMGAAEVANYGAALAIILENHENKKATQTAFDVRTSTQVSVVTDPCQLLTVTNPGIAQMASKACYGKLSPLTTGVPISVPVQVQNSSPTVTVKPVSQLEQSNGSIDVESDDNESDDDD